jgi:glycosyltransferase involved in cell wall biosynthesis
VARAAVIVSLAILELFHFRHRPGDGARSEEDTVRIALIAPPWLAIPPSGYGGTEAMLDGLARGLSAAGHEVVLCTTGDSTVPVERVALYPRALGVGAPGGALAELRHALHAYHAADTADIVHDHTLTGPLIGAISAHQPVVTTNHGPFAEGLDEYYRVISQRVPVIAISSTHAASARGVRLAGVIRHGLDVEAVPRGNGSGGYALFLGRMHPSKGVTRAIAVARAAGIELRIAAKCREPAERAYFEEVVRPLLGGNVSYIGEVGGAEKWALLGDACCLLNPIDWEEPFGMVMIEALATGTPVVATPRGAAREIVEHGRTGFLAADLAGLVEAVEASHALDRSACRSAAETHFSLERMVAEHVRLYERVRDGERATARQRRRNQGQRRTGPSRRGTPASLRPGQLGGDAGARQDTRGTAGAASALLGASRPFDDRLDRPRQAGGPYIDLDPARVGAPDPHGKLSPPDRGTLERDLVEPLG